MSLCWLIELSYSCDAMMYSSNPISVVIVSYVDCEALLGSDLAVGLDGDLVVGLECGDGVVGDLGSFSALATNFGC